MTTRIATIENVISRTPIAPPVEPAIAAVTGISLLSCMEEIFVFVVKLDEVVEVVLVVKLDGVVEVGVVEVSAVVGEGSAAT